MLTKRTDVGPSDGYQVPAIRVNGSAGKNTALVPGLLVKTASSLSTKAAFVMAFLMAKGDIQDPTGKCTRANGVRDGRTAVEHGLVLTEMSTMDCGLPVGLLEGRFIVVKQAQLWQE